MKQSKSVASRLIRDMAGLGFVVVAVVFSVASHDESSSSEAGDDSCTYANDGTCDDGSSCTSGTDCTDCGNCGDGTGTANNTFSCTSGDTCVDYYVETQAREDELRAQCASSSDSLCSIGGSSCTHKSGSDCSVTHQNPPADNFDSACTAGSSSGTLGANCP